ncbi:kinase-like protein, partial [Piedraia hortae CBS 480.64]
MTASSQPLGNVNAARRPAPLAASSSRGSMNPDIAAKMKAFSLSRQNTPAPNRGSSPRSGAMSPGAPPGFSPNLRLPLQLQRPTIPLSTSSPAVPRKPSLAEKRGIKLGHGLSDAAPPSAPAAAAAPGKRPKPKMTLSQMGASNGVAAAPKEETQLDKYSQFIDTKNGALTFKGRATVTPHGIEFEDGRQFHISLDEVDTLDELGKGNYGTVFKVRHARPKFRRQGQGLAGNKSLRRSDEGDSEPVVPPGGHGTTGIVMAMKEMRLELDDAKFQSIIMELDVLHRTTSPHIIDFYGAFFQEGAVYICMEFMDGGSMDKIYGGGVPESILQKMTLATTLGLKSLKEEHNIIHRDVKPTNILVNTRGQFKICDFGVSGNLVASIARTNIGCQSYMAPERISSGGTASAGAGAGAGAGATYSVQSDIWSLGLTVIECAMGRYPYPPETYDNIFSQLSAIVDGETPDLPADRFSEAACDFVAGCLNKIPKLRPTYPMLLQHAWLAPLNKPATISEEDEDGGDQPITVTGGPRSPGGFVDREVGEWVLQALEQRRAGRLGSSAKPALHAAPLVAV